jgi:transposase
MSTSPAETDATPVPRAARVAAPVAATGAATVAATRPTAGRVRPEQVEVVLSSDRRREHPPELRARLVAEMMAGGVVSAISRREGVCTSVLHRWHRRARREAGLPVASAAMRLLPVRVAAPETTRPAVPAAPHEAPVLEVVLGNGRVLRVPPGADPAVVAGLAAALER